MSVVIDKGAPRYTGRDPVLRQAFEDIRRAFGQIVAAVDRGEIGGAIDAKNNGTTAKTDAQFINIPTTNGSTTVLEFAANGTGADLRMKAPDATYKSVYWNGSAWAFDYVRGHS